MAFPTPACSLKAAPLLLQEFATPHLAACAGNKYPSQHCTEGWILPPHASRVGCLPFTCRLLRGCFGVPISQHTLPPIPCCCPESPVPSCQHWLPAVFCKRRGRPPLPAIPLLSAHDSLGLRGDRYYLQNDRVLFLLSSWKQRQSWNTNHAASPSPPVDCRAASTSDYRRQGGTGRGRPRKLLLNIPLHSSSAVYLRFWAGI